MTQHPYNLNENFANQFRSLLKSVEGKGISSAQNLQRVAFLLTVLSELSSKSNEWEDNKSKTGETVAESLVVAVELCKKILTFSTMDYNIKSPKLQNKIISVIKHLDNISRTASDLESTRLKEIENTQRKVFSESDDSYRQINPPEFRYDVTQQGTGRNARRESKNHTKSGTLKY